MTDITARGMAARAMTSGGGGGGGTTVDAYNKQETDSLLRGKANVSDVYNKTETGELLEDKVDKISGKGLSTNDYTNEDMSLVKTISNKANTNDVNASITNLQNQISETSENVDTINTELMTNAGYSLGMSINPTTFELTMTLKNSTGGTVSSQKVDLPIESMVVSASYANGKLSLKLQNGQTLDTDISAIVAGLVNQNFTIAGIDMKDNIEANELKTALGINTITSDVSTLKNDMSTAKANILTIQSNISGLKTRDSELQSDIDENTTAIEQNKSDILTLEENKMPLSIGFVSSNLNAQKWYKLATFRTTVSNNTFNSAFYIQDRKNGETGILHICVERLLSNGVPSATASRINAHWISAEYQSYSIYKKRNNFVIIGYIEDNYLVCELWCRVYDTYGVYYVLQLTNTQQAENKMGTNEGWILEKTTTAYDKPYDTYPELTSPTVRVVYTKDRLAEALEKIDNFETRITALETAQTTVSE